MARRKEPANNDDPGLGDIKARLKDLDSRLSAEQKSATAASRPSPSLQRAEDYSVGYKLVSEFAAGILVGAAIGYGLDWLLHTTPLFLIVFIVLGFAAGIMSMWRTDQKNRRSPEEMAKLPHVGDDDEDK